ncbi:hypothetical protein NGUA32_00003 [Salmonella enterica]|nr:hypothetical protein NGUA32_00003 [Salmonella enterica]
MRTHANARLEHILLRISMNIELPLAPVLLFLIQLGNQRIHPTRYSLLIRKIGFGQSWLIHQLFEQRFREATLHTTNHFLRGVIFRAQFF